MKTTKQTIREARQVFRLCLVDGELDEGRVRQVVQVVLQSGRRGYLALLSHFVRLVKLEYDRHTAKVESALPLPDDGAIAFEPLLEPPGEDGGGNPDCGGPGGDIGTAREDEDGVRNSIGSSSRGITRSLVSRTRS